MITVTAPPISTARAQPSSFALHTVGSSPGVARKTPNPYFVPESVMQEQLLKLEKDFAQAVISNDANAVDGFLADDWVIVDPDGAIIDKARFLGIIKSGVLSHETMESADLRVRLYRNTAVVTGLTTTKGKFMGQDFTSCERATDVFVKQDDRWQCVFTQLTRFTKK
jgi:ketosteroid isomerase-like protein